MTENNVKDEKNLAKNERREAMMRAAAQLFFEKGYGGTSLNAIIAMVGGSKRNFYTDFDGKEGLFKALVNEKMERLLNEQLQTADLGADLRTTLVDIAHFMIRSFRDPDVLGIYRLVLKESLSFPDLGHAFFESSMDRATEYITDMLRNKFEQEHLPAVNYWMAADNFVGMLHGKWLYEVLLGLQPVPSDHEINIMANYVVDLFLYGVIGQKNVEAGAN